MSLTLQLKKLVDHPPSLKPDDLIDALDVIIKGQASDIQIAALLTGLRSTGLDRSSEFVAAAASKIAEASLRIDKSLLNPQGYVDIVGTGGDGQNTFNVSTTAAIVGAGIGINVCKHGGKAATSASGAGDLLSCLGVDMYNVTHITTPEVLKKSQYCFLFAPVFHPVLVTLAPIRKALGIPTIFNILGPLLNPVPIKARIIGVFSEDLGQVFAEAVRQINRTQSLPHSNALIVWGTEGLDEISPAGTTKVWKLENDQISNISLHPSDFGLPTHDLSQVSSGTPQENANIVIRLLNNELPENHPILDYVLLNTAALAVVDGIATDWKHGVELARQSIRSGSAKRVLQDFVTASNATYD